MEQYWKVFQDNLNPQEIWQIVRHPSQFVNVVTTTLSHLSPTYEVHQVKQKLAWHMHRREQVEAQLGRPVHVEPIFIGPEGGEFFIGFAVHYPIPQRCAPGFDLSSGNEFQKASLEQARATIPWIQEGTPPDHAVVYINGPTTKRGRLNNGIDNGSTSTIPDFKGRLTLYPNQTISITPPGTMPLPGFGISLGASMVIDSGSLGDSNDRALLLEAERQANANGFVGSTRAWCGFLSIGAHGDVMYHEVRTSRSLQDAGNAYFFGEADGMEAIRRGNSVAWIAYPLLRWAQRTGQARRFAALEMTVSAKPHIIKRGDLQSDHPSKAVGMFFY